MWITRIRKKYVYIARILSRHSYFFLQEEWVKKIVKRVEWRHIKASRGGKRKNERNCNVYTLRFECSLFWNEEFSLSFLLQLFYIFFQLELFIHKIHILISYFFPTNIIQNYILILRLSHTQRELLFINN